MEKFALIWLTLYLSLFNFVCINTSAPKSCTKKAYQTSANKGNSWVFDKVKGTKILFKDGTSFETNLYELNYIGQVKTDNKAPFLIYSGRDCNECDANISIYFHSPRNGKLKVGQGENQYSYPGKELDYLDKSLQYEATAYYGEVLKGIKGIIWYEKSLLQKNTFLSSIFLARIDGNRIIFEKLKEVSAKRKAETLTLNKAGKNKEIKGMEYTSEP